MSYIQTDGQSQKENECVSLIFPRADPEGGTRGPDPPWNFGKKVVIRFVIGTGLILHSIYVHYSHKSKKGSKCGDLMVRT